MMLQWQQHSLRLTPLSCQSWMEARRRGLCHSDRVRLGIRAEPSICHLVSGCGALRSRKTPRSRQCDSYKIAGGSSLPTIYFLRPTPAGLDLQCSLMVCILTTIWEKKKKKKLAPGVKGKVFFFLTGTFALLRLPTDTLSTWQLAHFQMGWIFSCYCAEMSSSNFQHHKSSWLTFFFNTGVYIYIYIYGRGKRAKAASLDCMRGNNNKQTLIIIGNWSTKSNLLNLKMAIIGPLDSSTFRVAFYYPQRRGSQHRGTFTKLMAAGMNYFSN